MNNENRYDDPRYKGRIEAISPESATRMGTMDPIRAKYFNKLRTSSQLNIGGRRTNKNKKKHRKVSTRRRYRYSKKNRNSMKRK
jgi:hypothetical protein